MTVFRQNAIGKSWAAALAAGLAFHSSAILAAAITPSLSQIPLPGLVPVRPNIVLTIDNSMSTGNTYNPDYVNASPHCRAASGTPATTLCQRTGNNFDPPYASNAYNVVFYLPTATYVAVKPDTTALPCEGTNAACSGPWTAVYTDGFTGYPGANTGGTTNLVTSFPDTVWCWKSAPSAAEKATAKTAALGGTGTGTVCRLNGIAYPAGGSSPNLTPAVAAGYNYPNPTNPATGAATTCAANTQCKFIYPFASTGNPYYYSIGKVQFCPTKDTAGWGNGTCSDNWEATAYPYVRYGTPASGNFDPAAFTRVDIRPTILVNGVAAANPSGRTYADEMTNFARWYAFSSTRNLTFRSASGLAFSTLDQTNARVGFYRLSGGYNNANGGLLNVLDFNATNKGNWFTALYASSPQSTGSSPLPNAMWRIGQYFQNPASSNLTGALDPLDAATGKCQQNFHMMMTDGYWGHALDAGTISPTDQDKTVPALANLPGATGFTQGAQFPAPYYEGPTATNNTMADLAMRYWINDLRPTLPNVVKDSIAPWQHVTFYSLTNGARGKVSYPTGLDAITAGAANWPAPPAAGGNPSTVDDMWHAAVNGHGKFFNPRDPTELAENMAAAVADFTSFAGTGTAVGLAGTQLSATNKYAYKTSFEVGWWGDVKKYALDQATGVLPVDADNNPVNAPIWSAATQLDAQAAVVGAVSGWDTNRRIVTLNDSTLAAVPFRLANLSSGQAASLTSGWASVLAPPSQQAVLNWLRGDKSNEGSGRSSLRMREHRLGDIVYSGAVPVGAPNAPYLDTGTAGSPNPGYNAFKTSKASRAPTVYVGANDGMLHAFDDTTTYGGKETWAYIPKALFGSGDPNDTSHTASPAFQLGALAFRLGGIPSFAHKFYVNATPRVWDIDFAYTNTSTQPTSGNDWRTILVGGLGAGGRAVYALDVTNPVGPPPPAASADTETTAATKVLWEYTETNLGYVYDAPTLVKTNAYGWVVLVASGYNNPGGKGFLYVLNPKSSSKAGQLLQKIALPGDTGTDANPTGLSTIRAFASRQNPYVSQAYGGDLKGNVWRFDLSDANPSNWKAELIATLKDASDKPQSITTGVRIEIDQNNNVDRYLFIGTGKLLASADLSDTSVSNTLYVIKDGNRTTPEPAPATPYSRTNLNNVTGTSIAGFSGTATGRGWYQDAASSNQKITSDVYADLNTVVFAFSEPSTDPCLSATKATLFARDLTTGNSVLESGTTIVAGVGIEAGIAGVTLIQGDSGSPSVSAPVLVQVTTMTGQVYSIPVSISQAVSTKHRFSWGLVTP